MNIIVILVPLSFLLGLFFVFIFFRAVRSNQYEDLDTPAHRMLIETESRPPLRQQSSEEIKHEST